ncbi:50S ribosome-binding GTPase [Ceratobasidium sp. AG-Ba]|nr:50S ribosome-binding GTPase [Ceratobasidium sp. AG-Ba]
MSSLQPRPSLAVGPVNEASALDPTSRVTEHLPALPLSAKESTRKHFYETMSQPTRKLIIMGATGAGKSTFINSAAGSSLEVSNSLVSCTRTLGVAPLVLEDGTKIELVDTPGFDDSVRSDLEILEEIAMAIKDWGDIYGIIYLHRISDFRMSGAARKTFDACFHICGEPAMPWLTIATNMWDKVTPELGAAREDELRHKPEFFETAIKSGAELLRNDSPPTSARNIIQMAIRERPVSLQIQTQLCENDDDILATTAGKMLDQELAEKRAKHEAELAKISDEYGRALQQQDEETQAELEEEREMIRKKISEMQAIKKRIKAKQKPKSDRVHKPPRLTAPYNHPVHPPLRADPPSSINTVSTMSCYGASERTNWKSGPATYNEARGVTTSTRSNDGARIKDRAGNRRPSRARSDGEIARDIAMVKQQVMAMRPGTYAQSTTSQTQEIDRRYIARSSSHTYNPPYATEPSARGGYSTGREPLQDTLVERMVGGLEKIGKWIGF